MKSVNDKHQRKRRASFRGSLREMKADLMYCPSGDWWLLLAAIHSVAVVYRTSSLAIRWAFGGSETSGC